MLENNETNYLQVLNRMLKANICFLKQNTEQHTLPYNHSRFLYVYIYIYIYLYIFIYIHNPQSSEWKGWVLSVFCKFELCSMTCWSMNSNTQTHIHAHTIRHTHIHARTQTQHAHTFTLTLMLLNVTICGSIVHIQLALLFVLFTLPSLQRCLAFRICLGTTPSSYKS